MAVRLGVRESSYTEVGRVRVSWLLVSLAFRHHQGTRVGTLRANFQLGTQDASDWSSVTKLSVIGEL